MIHARDYVNILALTRDGEAIVLEGDRNAPGRSIWQVVSGNMGVDEDPLSAAQRVLEEQIGYRSHDWRYLSSFVVDNDRQPGTDHFFLADRAVRLHAPAPEVARRFAVRRVTPAVLKHALWDGRIGASNYAITVALGLLALGPMPNGNGRPQGMARQEWWLDS